MWMPLLAIFIGIVLTAFLAAVIIIFGVAIGLFKSEHERRFKP